jgi:hypothetical protein
MPGDQIGKVFIKSHALFISWFPEVDPENETVG